MNAFVAVTDSDWMSRLVSEGAVEANFWQPRPTRVKQPKWAPWIFKVRKTDRIAGFGFFSYWTTMPLSIAWETFHEASGASSYSEMAMREAALRGSENTDDIIGCAVECHSTRSCRLASRPKRLASEYHPR